ncbi:hypothetical protein BKA93DRAFT_510419 [Sparassis latifolia]
MLAFVCVVAHPLPDLSAQPRFSMVDPLVSNCHIHTFALVSQDCGPSLAHRDTFTQIVRSASQAYAQICLERPNSYRTRSSKVPPFRRHLRMQLPSQVTLL